MSRSISGFQLTGRYFFEITHRNFPCRGSLFSPHWTGVGLRNDLPRQLRNAGTRCNRDPYGDHEVDRIAHQITTLHSRTVLPSSLSNLGTCVMPLLEGRCPAQGAQVSSRSCPVIADGVARDKQGSAAERQDDTHNACH
jgi:hypothetical protein